MKRIVIVISSIILFLTGTSVLYGQTLPSSGTWGKFANVVDASGEIELTDDVEMVGVIRIPEGKTLKITSQKNVTIRNTGIGVYVDGNHSSGSSGRSRMFTVKGLKDGVTEHGKLIIEAAEGCTITLDGGANFSLENGKLVKGAGSRTLSEAIANEGSLQLKNVAIKNVDGAYGNGGAILVESQSHSTTLENCIISECNTVLNGGALSATFRSPVTFTGCTIRNCYSEGRGGALSISSNNSVTLNDLTIENCVSGSYGGAIHLSSSGTTTFDGCTIVNCQSDNQGGAIYLESSGPKLFKNGKIEGCVSQLGSAIMLMDSGTLTVEDSEIKNCISGGGSTSNSGGAIRTYGSVSASLYLTRVKFTGNEAKRNKNWDNTLAKDANGGALFWNARGTENTKCVINGCTFIGNKSEDNGGAIKSQGTLVFEGAVTEISGNSAPVGAGLYIEGYQGGAGVSGERTIEYNLNEFMYIHGNTAPAYEYEGVTFPGRGAGVHLYFGPEMSLEANSTISLNMSGAIIQNNTASGTGCQGGGIYFENTSLAEKNYTFDINLNYGTVSGNKAENGAGIYVSQGSIKSQNIGNNPLSVNGNTAVANGGGIYVMDGSLDMAYGNILSNSITGTGNGGGVYVENGNFTIDAGSVGSNSVASGMGAGVYVKGTGGLGNFTMNGGTIQNNTAASNHGGGVYVDGGNFTLQNGSINANSSGANGGGVYVNGGNFILDNANGSITGNTSVQGGGVFLNNGNFDLVTGTISGNTTTAGNGAGVYLTGENCVYKLRNGRIENNTAANGYGGGVYLENGSFILAEQQTDAGSINGNSASRGGGVFIAAGGDFTMNGGSVTQNSATTDDGGGVYLAGGAFEQNAGAINGNIAVKNGGGICILSGSEHVGSFTMNNGTIDGNGKDGTVLRTENGGGVYIDGGNLTVVSGTISNNGSKYDGGGLYILNGVVNMGAGVIQGNECDRYGGGVYVYNSSPDDEKTVSFTGGTLKGNDAKYGGGICVDGKIKLTIGNVEVAENEAVNGGGVCLMNNANMIFGAGQIKNNRAFKANPENATYSGKTAFNKDITEVEGIGAGVYLNSNTTLDFASTEDLGLFGNKADNAADEIFANGKGTSVNLPDVTYMKLDGYPGAGNLKWIEDYVTNDPEYDEGTKLLGDNWSQANPQNMRYRDMLANNVQNIPQLEKGLDASGKYICFALGYEIIYITLEKYGLALNESAIFTFSNTNGQKFKVIVTGNNTDCVSKDVAVTYGTWTVTETPWSWAYSVGDKDGNTIQNNSITKDLADKDNRKYTFKNSRKGSLPLNHENIQIDILGL